jgi:hypothetical protein
MRKSAFRVLVVLAVLCAGTYIVVQSVKETRDGTAARVTKSIPASLLAVCCFICGASIYVVACRRSDRQSDEDQKNEESGAKLYAPVTKKRASTSRWQVPVDFSIDLWCILFGCAMAIFAAGDGLFMAHDVKIDQGVPETQRITQGLHYGGVAVMAVGQIFLITALCIGREVSDLVKPPFKVRFIIIIIISPEFYSRFSRPSRTD